MTVVSASPIERLYTHWRGFYERHRGRLRRSFAGELVVRSIDLKLASRATVLSTQQVACLAPLAVGLMAMFHPSDRANVGRLVGVLLGLDQEANDSLTSLFTSSSSIAAATGAIGVLFLIGWAAAVPGYLQRILEGIWMVPARGIAASLAGQASWFLVFGVGAFLVSSLPWLMFRRGGVHHVWTPIVVLVLFTVVMTFGQLWTNYLLLGRQVSMRRLALGVVSAVVCVDAVLVGIHLFASPVINETVDQFGLIGITFLAQATAVCIAGALVFGELLGAELDRWRRPGLWPDERDAD